MASLMHLPAEIRLQIYSLVFDTETTYEDALNHDVGTAVEVNTCYKPSKYLRPLLTCRAWRDDATLFAFSRTFFVVQNPYTSLDIQSHMLRCLQPEHISAIRHLAVVADARHFRQFRHWNLQGSGTFAFGIAQLKLDELSIILRRSSYWHYLFDFNVALVAILRNIQGVERFSFLRNNAMIKGTLLTWYNRLVRLILNTDKSMRYTSSIIEAELNWWTWQFDATSQSVCMSRCPPKPADLTRSDYDEMVMPLYQAMTCSMENEEYDPDPFSRVSA